MIVSGGLLAEAARQATGKPEGEQRMGLKADEVDSQIRETREHIDESLDTLEQRAASNAVRYGRIAAVVLGVVAVAGTGVLIYRRMRRPSRREQLKRMVLEVMRDLPDSLRDLPGEVGSRLRKPLPSIKVVINGEGEAREPVTFEGIVRKVTPAVVTTASSALIDRLARKSDPSPSPRAYD
jgi:hypothetical protein